ncbi:MAG: DUF917 domain-containing protein [Pseudomonadota bacterium]
MKITAEDITPIALGGAFLATGGGGDTLLGEITAEAALKKYGPVELLDPADLSDHALVVALGAAGSPTIMQEKPSNGREAIWALEALEDHLGKRADALIAFEAGGVNALLPFCAAAERGLPVLDADGMGRAFPELQMESFSIYGVSATPLAAAGELGDRMLLENIRNASVAERIVRQFAVDAGGGQCISAEHVMDGKTARDVSILGTISLCLDIGHLLMANANDLETFLTGLTDLLAPTHYGAVKKLLDGKVIDISRRVQGGYDFGELTVQPFDTGLSAMTISIKNEYLIAIQDGLPVALTPDLICILDKETGRPITAETIRYGQRVTIIGIGAPERMRTTRALEVVSPRNFGFDYDYTAIENI